MNESTNVINEPNKSIKSMKSTKSMKSFKSISLTCASAHHALMHLCMLHVHMYFHIMYTHVQSQMCVHICMHALCAFVLLHHTHVQSNMWKNKSSSIANTCNLLIKKWSPLCDNRRRTRVEVSPTKHIDTSMTKKDTPAMCPNTINMMKHSQSASLQDIAFKYRTHLLTCWALLLHVFHVLWAHWSLLTIHKRP